MIIRHYINLETTEFRVVNLNFAIYKFSEFKELVEISDKKILLIQDDFEILPIFNDSNDPIRNECNEFIKSNFDKIILSDQINFHIEGSKYFISNGFKTLKIYPYCEKFFNMDFNKNRFRGLFLSNNVKHFRIKILNFLLKNDFNEKIAVKFNATNYDLYKSNNFEFNIKSDIDIPYLNQSFLNNFNEIKEPLYDDGINLCDKNISVKTFEYLENCKIHIGSETMDMCFCFSEKTFQPLLMGCIPALLYSFDNLISLKKLGFCLDSFYYKNEEEYFKKLFELLKMTDSDFHDYYNCHLEGLIHNHNLLKNFILNY